MKRLSYVLILILILPVLLFTGCTNEDRDFENLARTYNEYIASNTDLVAISNESTLGECEYNLQHFDFNFDTSLSSVFASTRPYTYYNSVYKAMIKNALDVSYFLIPKLLLSEQVVEKQENANIYFALDELNNAIDNTCDKVNDLQRSFGMDSSPSNPVNISHFGKFLESCNGIIEKSIKFSQVVLSVYDFDLQDYTELDLSTNTAQILLFNDIVLQYYIEKLYTTEIFYNCNFVGEGIVDKIINETSPYTITDFNNKVLLNNFEFQQTLDMITPVTEKNNTSITANALAIKEHLNELFKSYELYNLHHTLFKNALKIDSYYDMINENETNLTIEQKNAKAIIYTFATQDNKDRIEIITDLVSKVV